MNRYELILFLNGFAIIDNKAKSVIKTEGEAKGLEFEDTGTFIRITHEMLMPHDKYYGPIIQFFTDKELDIKEKM